MGVEPEVGEDGWRDLARRDWFQFGSWAAEFASWNDEQGHVAVVLSAAAVLGDRPAVCGVDDAVLGLDDQVGDAGIARRVAEEPNELRSGDLFGDVACVRAALVGVERGDGRARS